MIYQVIMYMSATGGVVESKTRLSSMFLKYLQTPRVVLALSHATAAVMLAAAFVAVIDPVIEEAVRSVCHDPGSIHICALVYLYLFMHLR